MKRICILGATGSIGTQTIEIIRNDNELKLIGISANTNYQSVISIINEFNPSYAALMDEFAYKIVAKYCKDKKLRTRVLFGIDGLNEISTLLECDILVMSVVGMIGLMPTINAIRAGKTIALANKETLVAAGDIVMREAKLNNVKILPVDSEHGAIFQCLQGNNTNDIYKIILTASGGPFRGKKTEDLSNVTLNAALNHPKWKMGKKISIDSATLMNKGLEVIEAHHLFNSSYENIEVVVHPQSIIHSMVEYQDGSIIAQLASTDMKLPIQYALNYPKRKDSVIKRLNFYELGSLTFEKPDMDVFKPLKLAYDAGKMGGYFPAILNSANEEAVALFINNKVSFIQIFSILSDCLDNYSGKTLGNFNLDGITEIDIDVKAYIKSKYKFEEV